MAYFFCYQCGASELVNGCTIEVQHKHYDNEAVKLQRFETKHEVERYIDTLMRERFEYGDNKPK